MAKTVDKLSDASCRAPAKAGERRRWDGAGLYLELAPSGAKLWRLKYRVAGREKRLAIGAYPEVSLKDARAARDRARAEISGGADPSATKRARRSGAAPDSFAAIAREWQERQRKTWTSGHALTTQRRLEQFVLPFIGTAAVDTLTPPVVLATLRRIEARGTIETAHRVRSIIGSVIAYAIATGRATRNPVLDLAGALTPVVARPMPAIVDPREVGALLRAIDGYSGSFVVRNALQLAPLVFVRPGELRAAEWSEFDLAGAEWRIPAARMKRRVAHLVPLSMQSLTILRDTHALTGAGRYVFPSARGAARPMSNAALNAALRRMGFERDEMVSHGFRTIASTLLNEQGWSRDAIERQLAHAEADQVRAAYHRAEHLVERRRMMQSWADYLDSLRTGSKGAL